MSPQIYRVYGKGVLMYIYVINKVYCVLLVREREVQNATVITWLPGVIWGQESIA